MKFIDERPKLQSKNPARYQTFAQLDHSSVGRAQIVASFVQDLFPSGPGPIQLSFIGGWLWLVPSVLHQQPTLDLAAESLASVYFAKKSGSNLTLVRSYQAYSSALGKLSKALQHPTRGLSSETLCAILLLVHYEVGVPSNRSLSLN
jgi:hypothetical protein